MKYVLALGAAIALFGAATIPALADECTTTTMHYADSTLPPICLVADTKTQHPDWFRDGGYCAGGTVVKDVTGYGHEEGCIS